MNAHLSTDASNRRPSSGRQAANVSGVERLGSIVAAASLLAWVNRKYPRGAVGFGAKAGAGLLLFRALTGFCPAYGRLGVNTRVADTKRALVGHRGVHVRESITIGRPIGQVYAIWRRLENLPRFMHHLERVVMLDEKRSHWVARPFGGVRLEWDAVIVNEVENQVIGWRSLEGADVVSAGSVTFREVPGGRGTEVRVHLQYSPPGGRAGDAVAGLLGADAATQVREDLERLKQWLESGDLATSRPASGITEVGRQAGVMDEYPNTM